jgi:hypothetical protein
MDFGFETFRKNLEAGFAEARKSIADLEQYHYGGGTVEQHEMSELRLKHVLDQIALDLKFAMEYLGLQSLLTELNGELQKYKSNVACVKFLPIVDVVRSPVLEVLEQYGNAMTSHVISRNAHEAEDSGCELLEHILRRVPKTLAEHGIEPQDRNAVADVLFRTLRHVFPDTVRESSLTGAFGSYEPAVGVRRLRSAVGYFFSGSEEEAMRGLGGVIDDLREHEGSEDWKHLYVVFHMKDYFLTGERIARQVRDAQVDGIVRPLAVCGMGAKAPEETV